MILERTELETQVKEGKIIGAVINGQKKRLFYAQGTLCAFNRKSSRRGYELPNYMFSKIEKYIYPKTVDEDKRTFKRLLKYKKEAAKATFTNSWIKACLALPDTFEQWIADGKKDCYEYHITTGTRIDGNLVSVKTIAKKMWDGHSFLEALANKTKWHSGRFPYNGYEGSIELAKDEDGSFRGFFSKEYKDCGNGYYYLLINDDWFMGYDID